jgi:hypothetical protein
MFDFEKNVLTNKSIFWELQPEIKDLVIKLNNKDTIQIINTRKRLLVNDRNRISEIFMLLSKNVKNSSLKMLEREAKEKLADFQMECAENGVFRISLNSPVQHNHNVFWNLIEKHLTNF